MRQATAAVANANADQDQQQAAILGGCNSIRVDVYVSHKGTNVKKQKQG